ncbi:MAG: hypothetical protein HKO59_07875 [Phycisphaerales bacterium]|nr:hypothetical protein [Phycisphaerales bacterium]
MIDVRDRCGRLVGLLCLTIVTATAAATPGTPGADAAIRRAAEELGEAIRVARQPLPAGQRAALSAVIMKVTGDKAQWRQAKTGSWRAAKADDVLQPGATMRTGPRSTIALRVGQNTTALLDPRTRAVLPEIVQEGDTLRTILLVNRGRADVKIDQVGLTNDASIVTPSATLAVRGTGFAVRYGAFDGTEVMAARTNEMFAIELEYYLSRFVYALSGAAISSDRHPHPVLAALFRTVGPPPFVTLFLEDPDRPETSVEPVVRFIVEELIRGESRSFVFDDMDVVPPQCLDGALVLEFGERLIEQFGLEDGALTNEILALQQSIDEICQRSDDPVADILAQVTAFCAEHTPDTDLCVATFRGVSVP